MRIVERAVTDADKVTLARTASALLQSALRRGLLSREQADDRIKAFY